MKIKLSGFDRIKSNLKRPISAKIRLFFKDKPCVNCGNTSSLVVDHKNDLYNNPNVLDTKTQTIDDFQSLCNGCNLLKQKANIYTRKENKRYPASKIPKLIPFNIDFVEGDETYDPNDPNAMIGTYWYDPCRLYRKSYKNKNK